eukprot:TRINITY_DN92964_c0_g1_i1.p1 TRINITY_DN92964_c0_g1~~TRINITY_DN92964_c0_g1_i1.p1  ORF type:complete len:716 (+),score=99.91 TRINITY_DN92964_c0_g1_i1:74-2221(+)
MADLPESDLQRYRMPRVHIAEPNGKDDETASVGTSDVASHVPVRPASPVRKASVKDVVRQRIESIAVQIVIIFLLFLDMYTFVIQTLLASSVDVDFVTQLLYAVDLTILGIFGLELIVKAMALGRVFFRDWLNIFDSGVVLASISLEVIAAELAARRWGSVLRALRLLRLGRIVIMLVMKMRRFRKQLVSQGFLGPAGLTTPLQRVVEIIKGFKQDQPDFAEVMDALLEILLKAKDLYAVDTNIPEAARDKEMAMYLEFFLEEKLMTDDTNQMRPRTKSAVYRRHSSISTPATPPLQIEPINFVPPMSRTDSRHGILVSVTSEECVVHNPATTPKTQLLAALTAPPLRKPSQAFMDHNYLELDQINSWEFDIFAVADMCNQHGGILLQVALNIFKQYKFLDRLSISRSKLRSFLQVVEAGYQKDNPYHNAVHAADVLQTMHLMLFNGGLAAQLTDIHILAALLAAIVHDYDHPGVSNGFLVQTRDSLAILYNDQAVLECHHCASSFRLMLQKEYNFVEYLPPDQFSVLRDAVINMVLGTDMKLHFKHLNLLKQKMMVSEQPEVDLLLRVALHAADISNPTKPWHIYRRWAERVMEEFYEQGRRERDLGLQISAFCNPDVDHATNTSKCQSAFIEYIVLPLFEVLAQTSPETRCMYERAVENKAKIGSPESFASSIDIVRPVTPPRDSSLPVDSTASTGTVLAPGRVPSVFQMARN